MRKLWLLIPFLAVGCTSQRHGGLLQGEAIHRSEHLVLVPLADSQMEYVRVFDSGPTLTAAIAKALKDQGYEVTVAKTDRAADVDQAIKANSATILICGISPEWRPDFRLVLTATRVGSGIRLSHADVAIGADTAGDTRRADLMDPLAKNAVDVLTHPPVLYDGGVGVGLTRRF